MMHGQKKHQNKIDVTTVWFIVFPNVSVSLHNKNKTFVIMLLRFREV